MSQLTLPDSIYSPDQLGTVVFDLNVFQGELRDYAARSRAKVKDNPTPEPTALLIDTLEANGLDHPTPDNLDGLRRQLEDLLAKAPVAHLTLAALPNTLVKKKLTAWFRTEISPYMLLTFAVRTDIGGGAVLQAGSHVYDFSFRNLLIANKQKLAEITARV